MGGGGGECIIHSAGWGKCSCGIGHKMCVGSTAPAIGGSRVVCMGAGIQVPVMGVNEITIY